MIHNVRLVRQLTRVHAVVGQLQTPRVYGLVGALGIQYETGHVARPRIGSVVFEPANNV